MKLREDPRMSYRGINNWPPVWTNAKKDQVRTVRGEVGILTYAYSNAELPGKCYLVIDYEGEAYVGTLLLENHEFCKKLCELLNLHLNKPTKDIGDLDLQQML
jgi:hypothetical protein